ncbi:MlaD family protein [bacterium]|nr:MlaD family protein [bacterium]
MNSRKAATLVGIAVLTAFVMVLVSVFYLRGVLTARDRVTYHAEFNNVGRLVEGNNVTAAGVVVGRVRKIGLRDQKAWVEFYVKSDVPVTAGTLASINATDVFGSSSVELSLGQGAPLPPGSQIEGELGPGIEDIMVRSAVIIDHTISLMQKAQTLLERLNTLTAQDGPVTESLENIREITVNTREFSRNLADYDILVRRALISVDSTAQGVDSLVAANSAAVGRTLANVESSGARLDSLLAGLQEGQGTLGRLLADESLYRDMRDALQEARSLIAEVREHPEKYVRVKVF